MYPYYGSDGSAALRAGYDFRVGLIGPRVELLIAWKEPIKKQ